MTCTLTIGDQVVLSSVGGAPEVEYALLDPGEIELAATGARTIQEVGYHTTADAAIDRLEHQGITWDVVLEVTASLQPTLAMSFARGIAVRRIATSFGPAELFDGARYDVASKQYEGRWLDLRALALELELPRFTHAVQLMHLLALLREAKAGDTVRLLTRDFMATARPGARSFRRGVTPPVAGLADKLRKLGAQHRDAGPMKHPERSPEPTDAELLEILRERVAHTPNAEGQDRQTVIERAIGIRQRPSRGPLADRDLWQVDEELSAGKLESAVATLDALETSRGKGPATVYLRARAAFLGGRHPPRAIAERVTALAQSNPEFVELELLAVEAWNAAGEPSRVLTLVRELASSISLASELLTRGQAALPPVEVGEAITARPPPKRVTTAPPATDVVLAATQPADSSPSTAWSRDSDPDLDDAAEPNVSSQRPPQTIPGAALPRTARKRVRTLIEPEPSPIAPAASRKETPAILLEATGAMSEAFALPVPTVRAPPATAFSEGTLVGLLPPEAAGFLERLKQSAADAVQAASRPPQPPPEPGREPAPRPRMANPVATELMRGASQPPFRSDSPEAHADIPRAASVPHIDAPAEEATQLEMPAGLTGAPESIDTLPRTVLDARVQFTLLSRELGRQYAAREGAVLRADISGVEHMQRVLLERYSGRSIATPEASADVRRHGAFLSEILARSFGAFWVDVAPSDVGYWAMVVPPSTRVWPFGRILRLIAQHHDERDLVSYLLELQTRAKSRG